MDHISEEECAKAIELLKQIHEDSVLHLKQLSNPEYTGRERRQIVGMLDLLLVREIYKRNIERIERIFPRFKAR